MRGSCVPLLWLAVPLILLAVVFALWLQPAHAQRPLADPLADPVVKGAWLYAGNCQRCHGDYGKARLAEDLSAKELKAAVSGDARQGCTIAWSLANGGPLPGKDISALVTYMTAWEQAGAEPALPPLPPSPRGHRRLRRPVTPRTQKQSQRVAPADAAGAGIADSVRHRSGGPWRLALHPQLSTLPSGLCHSAHGPGSGHRTGEAKNSGRQPRQQHASLQLPPGRAAQGRGYQRRRCLYRNLGGGWWPARAAASGGSGRRC